MEESAVIRTRENCIFKASFKKYVNGCKGFVMDECDPDKCPWHKTNAERVASLEKARQNYIKEYGVDEYGKHPYEKQQEEPEE
jgi:hypothetical protein